MARIQAAIRGLNDSRPGFAVSIEDASLNQWDDGMIHTLSGRLRIESVDKGDDEEKEETG